MGLRRWLGLKPSQVAAALENSPTELLADANPSWRGFATKRKISLVRNPLFDESDTFFTIGSCFAQEIRSALTARGVACLPAYNEIVFDPARAKIDTLPEQEHMNYYNTYSIRQEVERVAGVWTQDPADVWKLAGRSFRNGRVRIGGAGSVFQDPYRRMTFGATSEDLLEALGSINTVMAEGMKRASVFIITLGLTEVFIKKNNGLVANQFPTYGNGGGEEQTKFYASNFTDNLNNMHRVVTLIGAINSSARIVITVSPVPLQRTFSGKDIVVANLQSKSTLLAVAHEICDQYEQCYYFPSYEIVTAIGKDAFEARDGRHVKPAVVEKVIGAFIDTTFGGGSESFHSRAQPA